MNVLLAHLGHRAKAVVALISAVASLVVAFSADSTAGHVAAAVISLLGVVGVHQTRNRKKPGGK